MHLAAPYYLIVQDKITILLPPRRHVMPLQLYRCALFILQKACHALHSMTCQSNGKTHRSDPHHLKGLLLLLAAVLRQLPPALYQNKSFGSPEGKSYPLLLHPCQIPMPYCRTEYIQPALLPHMPLWLSGWKTAFCPRHLYHKDRIFPMSKTIQPVIFRPYKATAIYYMVTGVLLATSTSVIYELVLSCCYTLHRSVVKSAFQIFLSPASSCIWNSAKISYDFLIFSIVSSTEIHSAYLPFHINSL